MKKLCLALLVLLALGGRAHAGYCSMVDCIYRVSFVLLSLPGLEADEYGVFEVNETPDVNTEITFADEKLLYALDNTIEGMDPGQVGMVTVMSPGTTVKVLGYQWLMSPDGKHDNLFMMVQVVHQPEE